MPTRESRDQQDCPNSFAYCISGCQTELGYVGCPQVAASLNDFVTVKSDLTHEAVLMSVPCRFMYSVPCISSVVVLAKTGDFVNHFNLCTVDALQAM